MAEAIQSKGWFSAGMELFPATDKGAWHVIERSLQECDFYLLISGGRYGSLKNGTEKSYTELEYELARDLAASGSLEIAVLIWSRDDGDDYLENIDAEGSCDSKRQSDFHRRLMVDMEGTVGYFHNDASLISKTHAALDEFSRKGGPGWVKAGTQPGHQEVVALREQVNELNRQLDEAQRRINGLKKVAALPAELVDVECIAEYRRPGLRPHMATEIRSLLWSDLFSTIGRVLDDALPKSNTVLNNEISKEARKHFKKTSNHWVLHNVSVIEDDCKRILNHLVANKWVRPIERKKTGRHYEMTKLGKEVFLENEMFPSLLQTDPLDTTQ